MGDMMRGRYSPLNWINYAYNSGLLNQLSEAGGSNVITLETDPLLRTAQSGSQRSLNVFSVMTVGNTFFLKHLSNRSKHCYAWLEIYASYFSGDYIAGSSRDDICITEDICPYTGGIKCC
jgi:hypothetical protein